MKWMKMLPVIGAMAMLGCDDDNGNQAVVRLNMGTGAPVATGPALAPETYSLGGNTVVINQVQIVLGEIRLEEATGCTGEGSCADLATGPILIDLPLGGGTAKQVEVAVDTGTFGKLKYRIHKPESSGDSAFIANNPDFATISIKVTGTYNDTPFTYTSDLDVEQVQEFSTPIHTVAGGLTTLNLIVDLGKWFLNEGATTYIDPATANKGETNEGLVKSHIETSFHIHEG